MFSHPLPAADGTGLARLPQKKRSVCRGSAATKRTDSTVSWHAVIVQVPACVARGLVIRCTTAWVDVDWAQFAANVTCLIVRLVCRVAIELCHRSVQAVLQVLGVFSRARIFRNELRHVVRHRSSQHTLHVCPGGLDRHRQSFWQWRHVLLIVCDRRLALV